MTRVAVLIVVVNVVVNVNAALASPPGADLRLRRLPTPRTLKMRVAQTRPAPSTPKAGPKAGPKTAPAAAADAFVFRTSRRATADEEVRPPLAERVVARVDLGLAVDGARLSGYPNLDGVCPAGTNSNGTCVCTDADGNPITCSSDLTPDLYRSVRGYGFGEAYLGTRGVIADTLSTYVAAGLRAGRDIGADDPSAPLLSSYDRTTDLQTRAAWVESDGLFENRYLAPLRARAGRMYVYGPGIVHVDGALIAWERDWLEVSAYSGARVADYRVDMTDVEINRRNNAVGGAEIRADLHRWAPIAISASNLHYIAHDHSVVQAQLEPRRNVVIRSSTRFHDGELADQRLVMRARVSEASTVTLDGQYRTEADWFYDYASLAAAPVAGTTTLIDRAAARYLDLGPVRPRFLAAVIAGTVLAQNVDVLARGAIALDVGPGGDETELNPHLPEYIEGGAGIEVRLRRALAVQATVLVRDNRLPAPTNVEQHHDPQGEPGDLPPPYLLGEEHVIEVGLGTRYTMGARRFSATAELYGRQVHWAEAYFDSADRGIPVLDRHGGGRYGLEAWVSPQVRLRAEYDVSTRLELTPEVRGLKTLRLLVEGTY